MATITRRELRTHTASILARVQAGEEFVITHRGVPVAGLAPHRANLRPDTYLDSAVIVAALANLPDPEADAWLKDAHDADNLVDGDERDPWQIA